MSQFITSLTTTFKKQSNLGKIAIACAFLLILCCACSTPIPAASPSAPPIQSTPTASLASTPTSAPTQNPLPTAAIPTPLVLDLSPIPTSGTSFTSSFSCVPANPPQFGKVVHVVDGDTIDVQIDGVKYRVRYIGMDTPESTIQHEVYGEEASQKNAELVSDKDVILIKDVSETDQYDRLLRYVFVGDMFINYELVKQGFATSATYPPDVACVALFLEAQTYARSNSLGLWSLQTLATATLPASSNQPLVIVAVNKQAEYVDIKNVSPSPVDLNGWTLVSEKGNQRCGLSGIIQPGATLRIWAGIATDGGFSCGYSKAIWNNSELDPAVLYNPQGQEVDRYP